MAHSDSAVELDWGRRDRLIFVLCSALIALIAIPSLTLIANYIEFKLQ
jgi:hypothetical protein